MLTNHLVRELDDHDLSVLHTRNTQNWLVGVACVNPLHKKISRAVHESTTHVVSLLFSSSYEGVREMIFSTGTSPGICMIFFRHWTHRFFPLSSETLE